jgi:hypothetical protein
MDMVIYYKPETMKCNMWHMLNRIKSQGSPTNLSLTVDKLSSVPLIGTVHMNLQSKLSCTLSPVACRTLHREWAAASKVLCQQTGSVGDPWLSIMLPYVTFCIPSVIGLC